MSAAEIDAVGRVLVTPQRLPNPALVGRPATYIAQQAGITVPPDTRVLIAELAGVGRDFPLSIEKLCPVLSFYVVERLARGLRALQADPAIRRHGPHHVDPFANDDVILQFGLKKPAYRIVVNTPTTHGSIGLTTGLDPAMTLGCGGYGGNITSDNISPRHLLNIKRLAYEITPAVVRRDAGRAARQEAAAAEGAAGAPAPGGIAADSAGATDRPVPGVPGIYAAGARPAVAAERPRAGDSSAGCRRPTSAGPLGQRRPTRSKSLPSSYAKTTCGRRCGRVARS